MHKLRDEEKFDSLEELRFNIGRDTENAIAYFKRDE